MKQIVILGLLLSLFSVSVKATVVYVDSSHVGGTQNGGSWATAYSNLQTAITATNSGDSIFVAKGSYFPGGSQSGTNRDLFFSITSGGKKIYGGFPNGGGTRNITANPTKLDGNIGNASNITDNTFHVVVIAGLTSAADSVIIDGFVIQNGYANENTGGDTYLLLNGIYILRNWGGGVFIKNNANGGKIKITNCTITNNFSYVGGGGMLVNTSNPTISRCSFISNIANNSSYGDGGAICNEEYASPNLYYCNFINNTANQGGALSNRQSTNSIITHCVFSGNSAGLGGAAVHDFCTPKYDNCIFTGNSADNNAGAIRIYNNQAPSFLNCTFSGNKTGNGAAIVVEGGIDPKFTNCIIAGNGTSLYIDAQSTATIKYSLVELASGVYPGVGNLNTNPLFINAPNYTTAPFVGGDYQLQSLSPCLNAGINDSVPMGATDLANHTRIYGGTVDLGAYEFGVFPPVINLGIDTSICAGNTLTLDAQNSGATYVWSTGATSQAINVSTSGTYYVTATNAYGTSSDTIVVTVNVVPVVNLGIDTAICSGTSLTLNAQNAGATYLWNNANTAQTLNVTASGNYSVVVKNSFNCKATDTINIVVNPLPVVNLGNDRSICTGNSLTLNAQNNGASFLWNTGQTTQTLQVSTPGTYSVLVTNANNCKGRDTVVISLGTPPTVNLGNDTTFCAGNTLNAQNAGSTYLWNTAATTKTIALTTSGTYYVTVTDTNLCKGSDTINVIVLPSPLVNLGNDTSLCQGSSITLNAQNTGSIYLWSNGATTQTTTIVTSTVPAATGYYYYNVAVTGANQCIGRDTIRLYVQPIPVVNLGNDTNICAGSNLTLNAQNAGSATYLWSNAATTQTITANATGTYYVTVTNMGYLCKKSDTIQVTVNPLPTVNLGNDTVICSGNTLVLDAQNAGAAYSWSNGSTAQTLNVSTAGSYYVTVTNASGCKRRDTVLVNIATLPMVSLGDDTVFCAGNNLTLNAQNAGSTYLWNNNSTAHTLSANAAGIYYVTVTNANQCKGSDTIVIATNPSPLVNLGNDTTICNGAPVALTLNAENPGATYLWNNNSTAQTLNVTTAGAYFVSVTNAYQCNRKDTIVISAGITPSVNLGNDTAFCAGNTLTLNAQNTGAVYLWNNAATTQSLGVTTSGTYYVIVTASNQCKGSDTINVTVKPLPVVHLGNDTSFCNGNSLILNAQNAGATYLWSNSATTQTINANTSGTYFVTVTGINLCSGADTIQIVVNPLPIISLGSDTFICAGNILNLNAQNLGATYLWGNGATSQTIDVDVAGVYNVMVTDVNSCMAGDTILVAVNPLPIVNLGNDTAFCAGNSLTLNAQNAGATYLWSTGATTQTINVNATGVYGLGITDVNGCKGSDTIQVTANPAPVVDLGNDVIINTSSYIIDAGNAGATYLWSTGATTQTVTVTSTGTYSVIVTNTDGCSASDTINVTFDPTGIQDVNAANHNIKVIPNPAKDIVYIQTEDDKLLNQHVTLTDSYGRMVRMITIKSKSQELSLTGLAQGIYFLKIQAGGTLKIAKE